MSEVFYIAVTLAAVSIINTAVIFFVTRFMDEEYKRFDYMWFSSNFMMITLILMVHDIRAMELGLGNLTITFFEYGFLAMAFTYIVKAIARLYGMKETIPKPTPYISSILLAIIATIATYYDNMILRELVLIYTILISFGYLIFYMKKNHIVLHKNIFFYQSMILIIMGLLDLTRVILGLFPAFHESTVYDFLLMALGLIVFMSIQTSYLVELYHVRANVAILENLSLSETMSFVKKQSEKDVLTSLCNRRKIKELLHIVYEQAKQEHVSFSVIMCDVNDLKQINDTYGHPFGDSVLQYVAKILDNNTRENDIVARYGGDEFLIVLQHNRQNVALNVIKTLKEKFADSTCEVTGHTIAVSMGAASYEEGKTLTEIIAEADNNMYIDKRNMKKETGNSW